MMVSAREDHGTDTPWVGRSMHRREDPALLRGAAHFLDDLSLFKGTREAAILRSPHAHARIVKIDVSAALELPGVSSVLTGQGVAGMSNPVPNVLRAPIPYYPIAIDRVRFVGEPVAVVVARDRYVAEDALERIEVEYETLRSETDPAAAAAPDAFVIHESLKRNIVHQKTFRFGDPEAAFSRADRIVSIEVDYPRITSTPLETYGVVADYALGDDRYTIWSNFQGPFIGHSIIAGALRTPTSRVRMISAPSSGGSFGVKWGVFSYAILIALAARKAGTPVKWIEDRAEHLAASSSSTSRRSYIEGAFSASGRLLGLRIRQMDNVGAYLRPPEPATLYRTHGNLNGPYDVRDIAVENSVVLTNQMPSGLNRGFGGPQYFFPLERLMNEAARQLAIDPYELRILNVVSPQAMPYVCASGAVLDGGNYPATLKAVAEKFFYEERKRERDKARSAGDLAGIGIALAVETSSSSLAYVNAALSNEERAKTSEKSGGHATATLSADPAGRFILRLATVPAGQGHETVLSQIVADELGIRPEEVEVVTSIDTNLGDWSIASGNYTNRFSGADTTAAVLAARKVAAKFRLLAAAALSCLPDEIELADGLARVKSRNIHTSLKHLAAWSHWNSSNLPDGVSGGIIETATFTPTSLHAPDSEGRVQSSLSTTLMCDMAAVRICRNTGRVEVTHYAIVHDVGRMLNPALVEGQTRGGFAHGLGAALLERIIYDGGGNLLTGTFADYLCPSAADIPNITIGHVGYPTDRNALGARGLGDGSSMNPPAAITNAVADALGLANISIPLTPNRVWSLINGLDPDANLKTSPGTLEFADEKGPLADSSGAQLVGEGQSLLPGTPEAVWKTLFAVEELARIIPGCRELIEIEPDKFKATIVVSVAGMSSTYAAQIELGDKVEASAIRISGRGEGGLGHGRVDAIIRLVRESETTTRLSYRYRAQVGGRVASVGHRMLDGGVRLLIGQFFTGLSRHLDAAAGNKKRGFRAKAAAAWRFISGRARP
ncbi:MAG: molybdopterin cofactor-binding domain-containing protein [Pseudomonadota bacterium]